MRKKLWIIGWIAACAIAAIGLYWAYRAGAFLPGWICWEQAELSGQSASEPDAIALENKRLQVLCGDETVWSPDQGVLVQSFLWCDIDRDGARELLILCWKQGKYGQSRPFWEEGEDNAWSQHIFIYSWTGETMRPRWMASDLGREVEDWYFDEEQRLVLTDRNGQTTAWDWVTWGLTNIPLKEAQLSFGVLGENLIHRQIYDYAFRNEGGSFSALYAPLAQELSRYDVTAIHQEGLYVEERAEYASFPLIGTPIEVGQALAEAGFSVVSCAGNHALDFGSEAIDRTAGFFAQRGILTPGIQSTGDGAYRPYELLERKGFRCAFLGFTQSTNGHRLLEETPYVLHTLDDPQQVREALSAAREEADLVIVFVHWGTEYAQEPDDFQREWAQIFADCGVDVVLGAHPHVLQPYEWVEGEGGHKTLVYYSLGNYISAQTDPACKLGGLAWFTVKREEGTCCIADYGLKTLQTTEENGRYSVLLLDP